MKQGAFFGQGCAGILQISKHHVLDRSSRIPLFELLTAVVAGGSCEDAGGALVQVIR